MSKEDKGGKIRVTVIQFDLEGSNETLQEGLRSAASTITRSLVQARAINAPPAQLTNGNGSKPIIDVEPENTFEENDFDQPASPAEPKTKKSTQYSTPKVLDNIDLKSGELSFEDFVKTKGLTDQSDHTERFLAISYWFKEYGNTPAITAAHVFTCYRYMKWASPRDIRRTLAKLKDNGWASTPARGQYEINHIGINEAEKINKQE